MAELTRIAARVPHLRRPGVQIALCLLRNSEWVRIPVFGRHFEFLFDLEAILNRKEYILL